MLKREAKMRENIMFSQMSVNRTLAVSGDICNDQKSGFLPLKEFRTWCMLGKYSELHCSQNH